MLVLCAGLPKAGSTLQYNLVKALLGDRLAVDFGWVPAAKFVHGFEPDFGDAAAGRHSVLKCHRVPKWVEENPADPRLRIVSTYRDLRDVAASAIEFQPEAGWDNAIATLDLSVQELARLERFGTCLIQRYETMMSDLPSTVAELGRYIDCPPTDADIVAIVAEWQVGAAQERAQSTDVAVGRRKRRWFRRAEQEDQQWDPDTLLWPTHISSSQGRPGRFEGVLTPEHLSEIDRRYGDWLRARSYA